MQKKSQSGAELLVECLKRQGVKYIFGVPGASLMPILDILYRDRMHADTPKFVLCRHEQSSVFMAQCWGRLTGNPGVCMATAGPGATNLVTGMATGTADRDPIIAITGENVHGTHFKKAHQNLSTARLFRPITKMSHEVGDVDMIPEAVGTAFRTAMQQRQGAVHLSLPLDILKSSTDREPLPSSVTPRLSVSPISYLHAAATVLKESRHPVILLGLAATEPSVVPAVRRFIARMNAPVIGTFEAAGTVPRSLVHLFCGRVGLKAVEPGDVALQNADAVIAVGYDTIEYAPNLWNTAGSRKIIHIDFLPSDPDLFYQPAVELVGSIADNLDALRERVEPAGDFHSLAKKARQTLLDEQLRGKELDGTPIHPLRLMHDLRETVGDDATVISDVGSHQVWLAKYFFSYEPRTLLFSMGFQTMGVALPWAIATTLARPKKPVVSNSGDGSFLMSATELETAVRLKARLVHIVWRDGSYNLVKIQQLEAYDRAWGVEFGNPDIVAFAKSFGAAAYRITKASQIKSTLKKALATKGPCVIDVPMDYRENLFLLKPREFASAL